MIRKMTLLAIGAAALAACNSESHTITDNEAPDPMADQLANAAPVELPPAIAATNTYRCKDNSLLYIDWYSDGSARVKTEKGAGGTQVPAPAEGVKSDLTGNATSSTITYAGKTCHV